MFTSATIAVASKPSLLIWATRLSISARRRALATSFAPRRANSRAAARPIPELEPVTSVTLFSKVLCGFHFSAFLLLVAITTGTIYNAVVAMGRAYWIPAFGSVITGDPLCYFCCSPTMGNVLTTGSTIALVPIGPSRTAAFQP